MRAAVPRARPPLAAADRARVRQAEPEPEPITEAEAQPQPQPQPGALSRDSSAEDCQVLADGDASIYAKDGGDVQLRPAGSWRWIISLLALVMWLVCYADRTNISLAIIEMEEEYGWDHAVDGVVLSSFFWG